MESYNYRYKDIIKYLIKKLHLTETKSKYINPNVITSYINQSGFEDTIICYVDVIYLLKRLYNPFLEAIALYTALGFTEDDIAAQLGCSQANINYHKKSINRKLRLYYAKSNKPIR